MINAQNQKKLIFNINKEWSKLPPYEFWHNLGNPKYVCAPMVDQSELAFRKITRKYGCDLTFTPMIHSVVFANHSKYREKWIKDISEEDQPCFVQMCGHDPEILLKAAKYVEFKTPCIDLNLGCPQGIAKKGNYGSFLLEQEDLVIKILTYLVENLHCGVSCKIRLFQDLQRTYQFVSRLEQTGIKVLTVHGRTKDENKQFVKETNLEAIKKIKEIVKIPVIANGSIESFQDAQNIIDYTKCDAVMSAEKLLENPFIFSGQSYNIDDIAIEYIEEARKLDTEINFCRSHLFKFYYGACKLKEEYNQRLATIHTYEEFLEIAKEIREFRISFKNEEKFGWYFRYRKDENPFKYIFNEKHLNEINHIVCDSTKNQCEIETDSSGYNNITTRANSFNKIESPKKDAELLDIFNY
jgi:tRNA-dihydrouridine synthase